MASGPNLFQIKRTAVAGRAANTVTLPNPGELSINMIEQILYSTNGEVVFEICANVANQVVRTGLVIGNDSVNTTSNSTQINTEIIQLGTAVYVGGNVDVTVSGLYIGNTTANLIANSIIVSVANSTGTSNLQPTQLVIGTSTVNTTVIAAGANVIANTSTLYIGNSTVNAIANSLAFVLSNSTVTFTISKPNVAQVSDGQYYLAA